jgi:HAD superfamily hydrolase (TIGR01509 family)
MIKAIIFDCYGVLVEESWKKLCDEHFGASGAPREWADAEMHRVSCGEISDAELAQIVAQKIDLTADEVLGKLKTNPPNEPLLEYIATLKSHYKIGFLSNVGANYLDRLFTPEHRALFDVFVLSFEVGMAKPQPEIYQHTAGLLDVRPEECVFIDDTRRYCEAAEQTGMSSILYTNFADFKKQLEEILT